MSHYLGNVAVVFGNEDMDRILDTLHAHYGLTVDTIQTVTEDQPYQGEIRTEGNTLLHIATEVTLSTGLYELKYIESTLPLEAVQMTREALKRANLILVLMKDGEDAVSYYPHTHALYCEEEDCYS